MRSPSININAFVGYEQAVEVLGLSDTPLTSYSRCPVCKKQVLRMAVDPLGGFRYRCTHCDTNLDTIQLLSRARDIPIAEAVHVFAQRCPGMPPQAKTSMLDAYQLNLRKAEELLALLKHGTEQLAWSPTLAWSAALAALKVDKGGSPAMSHDMFKGVLSGIRRSDLQAIYPGLKIKSPTRYVPYEFVALPLCDVFNRPRTLRLFDKDGLEHVARIPVTPYGGLVDKLKEDGDDGLAFLDLLKAHERDVFAVHGARSAMQLMCMALFDAAQTIPIVGWSDKGTNAWQAINADRVIFWSDKLSADLFRHAMACTNGYVAIQPDVQDIVPGGTTSDYLQRAMTGQWVSAVAGSARKWPEALAVFLLSMGEQAAITELSQLHISNTLAHTVIQAAPEKSRDRLSRLFGYLEAPIVVNVDGTSIEQVGTVWNEVTTGLGNNVMILDAAVYLDSIQVDSADARTVHGTVVRNDSVLPFYVDYDEITNKFDTWLEDFLISHDQPAPIVSPRWRRGRKNLYLVAQAFHNPPVQRLIDSVGWADNLGHVFPGFRIHDGEVIDEAACGIARTTNRLPGESATIPNINVQPTESQFNVSSITTVLWGILGSIITNLLSKKIDREMRGIAVMLAEDDAGFHAVQAVSDMLGLPMHKFTNAADAMALDVGHGLPPVIDARRADRVSVASYIQQPGERSTLMMVRDASVFRELSQAGWIVVAGYAQATRLDMLDVVRDTFFRWLSELDVIDTPTSVRRTLDTLPRFFGKFAATMAKSAKEVVGGDEMYRTVASDRVLAPYLFIESEKTEAAQAKSRAGELFKIGVRNMGKSWTSAGFAKIDIDKVSGLLRRTGHLRQLSTSCLSIPAVKWDEAKTCWEKLRP